MADRIHTSLGIASYDVCTGYFDLDQLPTAFQPNYVAARHDWNGSFCWYGRLGG